MKSLRILTPLVAAVAFSPSFAASLQQEQRPRFRTEVAAVLVDVLVLDESGEPVSGLSRDDFEVYEDGVQQEIENFEVIDWTSYVARATSSELRPAPVEPAAVNTFPRRFVFIVNRQGAEFGYIVRARKAMETFVIEAMADGDEAMILDVGMSTKIVQQFTPMKEEVLQAVRKLRPMPADVFYGTHVATRNVFETLESLGEQLGAVPGRKVVLFMSPELEKTRDLIPELQRTIDALNQSNTTVYSIDIRGATAGTGVDEDRNALEQEAAAALDLSSELANVPAVTSPLNSFDIGGLFPLAYETGGRYYTNLNTFEPVVQRIGQENRRYYLLTYVPENVEIDGRYRRIEVRVNRPNVTVKARKGYFPREGQGSRVAEADSEQPAPPQPVQPENAPKPRKAPTRAPAPLGLTPPSEVVITNYLFPGTGGKLDVPVAVALPLELAGGENGRSTLTLTWTDGSGNEVARYETEVGGRKFYAAKSALLAPGSYLLHVSVTQSGQEVYQVSTQVDVPSGYGKRFGLSAIVPIFDPTQASNIEGPPIRPTPTLRVGEDAFLHFRILPGTEGEPSKQARILYSIYRDDEEITSLEQPEPVDLTGGGEKGSAVVVKLPTGKLPAGTYRVVVRIRDPNLGRSASGEIKLTMQP